MEEWMGKHLRSAPVLMRQNDRECVEKTCLTHCEHRGWFLHATNARSNHVHLVVSANAKPKTVRSQLKANCTRALRMQPLPLIADPTWAKGGDIALLKTDTQLENAIRYVTDAQERPK